MNFQSGTLPAQTELVLFPKPEALGTNRGSDYDGSQCKQISLKRFYSQRRSHPNP